MGSSQPGRPPPGVTGAAVVVGVAGWVVVTGAGLAVDVVAVGAVVVPVVLVVVGRPTPAHSGAVPGSAFWAGVSRAMMSGSQPRYTYESSPLTSSGSTTPSWYACTSLANGTAKSLLIRLFVVS